ncbi:MAG: beta-lactamase family protein [Planctomycetes bacterium]|nr:beta-lactamase family protein [Planctomycetota bacterium]
MEHLMRIVKQALVLALLCPVFPGLARSADVDVEKLSAYISKAREDWAVPGLAVAIVKDGKVALARGYGVRELGGDKAVDADTLRYRLQQQGLHLRRYCDPGRGWEAWLE